MDKEIQKYLKEMEKEFGVTILWAVESGSRAWGMESENSDYDVRFIYKKNSPKDYVSIFGIKEVIERNYENLKLDFVGFDILKYAKLLAASNPAAIEWLHSDILYAGKINNVFRAWSEKNFNPLSLYQHYKSMCKSNYLKYIEKQALLTLKKYLYVMRGLINAEWVLKKRSIPPIKLVDAYVILPKKIKVILDWIIYKKKKSEEKDREKNLPELNEFIEEFLSSNVEPEKKTFGRPNVIDEEVKRIIF